MLVQSLYCYLSLFCSSINVVLRGVANKQADIHRFIAYCEIFGLFIITLKVFT